MKGLILKDIYLTKGSARTLLVMIVAFVLMSFQNIDFLIFFLPFLCIMICISTFNYDEYNKWDAYAITLPNGRKNIVKSKYFATILMIIIGMIISIVITGTIGILGNKLNVSEFFDSAMGSAFAIIFVVSIMYPLIYKFGAEKGRIFLFVIGFLFSAMIGAIVLGIEKLGIDLSFMIPFFNQYFLYILPMTAIILLLISYLVSYRIYQKKEF